MVNRENLELLASQIENINPMLFNMRWFSIYIPGHGLARCIAGVNMVLNGFGQHDSSLGETSLGKFLGIDTLVAGAIAYPGSPVGYASSPQKAAAILRKIDDNTTAAEVRDMWRTMPDDFFPLEQSISHGTLNPDDLIAALAPYALRSTKGSDLDIHTMMIEPEYGEEQILETIFDYMNDLAPEGYYFGAHPGDGSDFGFWKMDERV